MTDLEELLRNVYLAREDDMDVGVDQLRAITMRHRPHRSRRWWRRPSPVILAATATVAVLALVTIVVLALSGTFGVQTVGTVDSTYVYGARTYAPLTVRPPGPDAMPRISKSAASKLVKHPFAEPELDGRAVLFALGDVTATQNVSASQGVAPSLTGQLAWVAVYRVKTGGDTSCPAEPVKITKRTPPLFKHYYFAVIVNAQTGDVLTWNEDESGEILRECAAALDGAK